MNDLLNRLLAFLEELLSDPQAAEEFRQNPEGMLHQRGLGDITITDIDAVLPIVIDYAPVNNASVGAREYNTAAAVNFAPVTYAPIAGHARGQRPAARRR